MNWRVEAEALIDDAKAFVYRIEISNKYQSSETRIYFEIETLERKELTVSMDSSGFEICDDRHNQDASQTQQTQHNQDQADAVISTAPHPPDTGDDLKVYETINALLSDNSPMYRKAFAEALIEKMQSIQR